MVNPHRDSSMRAFDSEKFDSSNRWLYFINERVVLAALHMYRQVRAQDRTGRRPCRNLRFQLGAFDLCGNLGLRVNRHYDLLLVLRSCDAGKLCCDVAVLRLAGFRFSFPGHAERTPEFRTPSTFSRLFSAPVRADAKDVSHLRCSKFWLRSSQRLRAGLTFVAPTALGRLRLASKHLVPRPSCLTPTSCFPAAMSRRLLAIFGARAARSFRHVGVSGRRKGFFDDHDP